MKKPSNADFMRAAVAEARRGVLKGDGGPFGAVAVKDGAIIARAHNRVVAANDPTAHAEILALRKAARKLGRFHLPDCEIYTTCEPCPMCLAAMRWAWIRAYHFGCTRRDAARIGFADEIIREAIAGKLIPTAPCMSPLLREECYAVFELWRRKKNRIHY